MTFLPLVERELRIRARGRETYWLRIATGGAAVLLALILLAFTAAAGPRAGSSLFSVMAGCAFLFCLLGGAWSTANCLSVENREGTLGLLFLTDLRGRDVVLGKLAGASLNCFYALLATLPALAIPLIVGGVTAGEFWRLALVLINTLFYSASAGLLVSAAGWGERRSLAASLGLMVISGGLLHGLVLAVSSVAGAIPNPSPTAGFSTVFDTAYRTRSREFWWTFAIVQAQGWIMLIAASWLLPRMWRGGFKSFASPGGSVLPCPADSERRRVERQRLLNASPALWLARRHEDRRRWLWLIVALASLVAVALFATAGGGSGTVMGMMAGALLLHLVLAGCVAAFACYALADARDSGAMELLLTTPLSPAEIVNGHVMAIRHFFFRPVLTLLLVEAGLVWTHALLEFARVQGGSAALLFPTLCTGVLMVSVLDLYAAGHFGLWAGLRFRQPGQALTRTVLLVMVLPLVFLLLCFALWPVLNLAKSALLIQHARRHLTREFRERVARRFDSPAPGLAAASPNAPVRDAAALPDVLGSRGKG